MLGVILLYVKINKTGAPYTNGITRQAPNGKRGGAGWARSETKGSSELKLWSGPAQPSTGRDLTARMRWWEGWCAEGPVSRGPGGGAVRAVGML